MRRFVLPLAAAILLCVPSAAHAAYPVGTSFVRELADHLDDPWTPPPGANVPCTLTPEHPRPVVLVHGTLEAPVVNWSGLAPYLANEGFCVYAPRYGMRSGLPGLADIRRSAAELSAAVDGVLAQHPGAAKVDLVGHSQGGMMPRWYLKSLGGTAKVHRLIAISPSSHGTTVYGLSNLVDLLRLRPVVALVGPALQQQIRGSSLLRELNAGDETPGDVQYDVIASKYDEVVTPYGSQRLDGASWWVVQQGCALDLSEHAQITYSPRALARVANLLDGGTRRLPCRYVAPIGLG
ncbi:MAG: esterase/lipase family protein [Solirubrobacteraceae bacterium]